MKSVRNSQRGTSLAETTIVMGVVLALIFGVIDFGRAMYTYAFVAQIAREGARWAIVRGAQCTQLDHCNAQSSDVQTYVQSLSEGATNPAGIHAIATWPSCPAGATSTNEPGCTVSVNVTYTFAFIAPFVSHLTMQLSSTSQMVISQ
ncbi:MAG TPA: TadE/TadG family type IV pilus assembly protein [Candidatus Cybelea sp.]